MNTSRIRQVIEQSIDVKQHLLSNTDFLSEIDKVSSVIIEAYQQGNKVLFCGNGGSAADAQHLAAELSGRFYYDRPPLAAEALHVNTSYLTAVANDYSYDIIYARIVEAMGKKGDILIGLSTSGNSKNVIAAMEKAKQKGMTTISLTGLGGGLMAEKSDYLLAVPSADTPRIQESHIMIGHIICELVESTLFPR
ncbi:MAG: D-sedoheptulose 7-phosphate isomerase [Bacteroidales bacterium]|jgi:D-sedoheptulose 7-phosphate isomerase|nr:D-sedoheptulose 7-phosphate isomerase [Bacteroidales bacterium]